MFACTVPPAEDVLHDWAHPDCSVARERAPYLPLGATRSCVHISSRAVTHSRGERALSWGQHLCSPAKKARLTLRGQAAVQHSMLCAASTQARVEELRDEQEGWENWEWRDLNTVCVSTYEQNLPMILHRCDIYWGNDLTERISGQNDVVLQ